MGRLSAYAKNRILKLRFKKNKRIIHIVEILKRDDNIKVSRQAVSTFLKKYLETNSIYDKPRTGRKRKLTPEEIQLIGQVTRLNRDITARAIKEYLNLNVSTYTILRATKLFEWNKVNLNSNEAKRQLAAEKKKTTKTTSSGKKSNGKGKKDANTSHTAEANKTDDGEAENVENDSDEKKDQTDNNSDYNMSTSQLSSTNEMVTLGGDDNDMMDEDYDSDESGEVEKIQPKHNVNGAGTLEEQEVKEVIKKPRITAHSIPDFEKVDLQMLGDKELMALKNLSCSPMSFATKILFKIFKEEELHGHNVSGKTLNRNMKTKLPLDPLRVGYIKFLVEAWYDESEYKEMLTGANNKQDLWKSCHTAINKSILISERKSILARQQKLAVNGGDDVATTTTTPADDHPTTNGDDKSETIQNGCSNPETTTPLPAIAPSTVTSPKKAKKSNKDDVYEFQNDEGEDESDEDFDVNNKKKKRKVTKSKKVTNKKKSAAAAAGPKRARRRYKSSDSSSSSDDDDQVDDDVHDNPARLNSIDSEFDDDEMSSCSSDDDDDQADGSLPLHMDEELEARIRQYKAKQQSLGATTTNFRRNLDSMATPPSAKKTTATASSSATSNVGSSNKQQPSAVAASSRKRTTKTTTRQSNVNNNDSSSEALAAANIAASMKKRLVVVSDLNDSIGNVEVKSGEVAVATATASSDLPLKPTRSSPKSRQTAKQTVKSIQPSQQAPETKVISSTAASSPTKLTNGHQEPTVILSLPVRSDDDEPQSATNATATRSEKSSPKTKTTTSSPATTTTTATTKIQTRSSNRISSRK